MLIESCHQTGENEHNDSKSEPKVIITCRENIYVHKAFPKLTCFSLVQCSFSSEYKISPEEMRNIALSYLPENTVNDIQNLCRYDFFPLICSLYSKSYNQDPSLFIHPVKILGDEISEMKNKSESSFLCISLLVLRNNHVRKDELGSENIQKLVKAVCLDCEIESDSIVAILNSFERLKGVYITESDDIYTAIHDKMFDIVSAAIAPTIMKCLIEHVDIGFLANRTNLSSFNQNSVHFVIHIPPAFESLYLKRQITDAMKGKYWEVFGSTQTENAAYRKKLLSFLKEQDLCQQMSYASTEDGNNPLYVSSHLGYLDFVEYFIVKSPNHLEVKDNEGRSPLYVACEKGHIAVVRYLIQYHEDINAEDRDKTTALSATCLNGHLEVAQLLLYNNADINISNKYNQDTLYFACLNGNVELVNLLLSGEYNVDISNRDTFGRTAVHAACKKGHTETVKTVLEFGSDVNKKDKNGSTPLYLACGHGCNNTVKYLLQLNGQELNTRVDTLKDEKGWSSLHAACQNGHIEVVKLLIDVGMNINDTTKSGATPLHKACQSGHNDIVKLLLDSNGQALHTRVNITVKRLHKACQSGHSDIVKFLLNLNGQSLNCRVHITVTDEKGWSSLHVTCQNGHIKIVKLLIDAGVNLNDTSNNGSTPLFHACKYGQYEIVKYLLYLNGQTLNRRVDTTIKNQYGWSALHMACTDGHIKVVKLLINVGMNINDTTNSSSTPLYKACQGGHYDTVKFLLDLIGQASNRRVDTTIKDMDGWSILHTACFNGHAKILKLLIDVGMNMNEGDRSGKTAVHLACINGHENIVKILKDNCAELQTLDSERQTPCMMATDKGYCDIMKLLKE